MTIQIRVDAAEAKRLLARSPEGFRRALRQWFLQGSRMVEGTMKEEINRRRKHVAIGGGPRLAATVQASVQPDRAVVEPTKRYTTLDGKVYGPEVVDQPTGPHPIGAKRAKALTVPIGFGHGFSLGLGTRKGGARFSKIFFAGKTRNIKGSGGGVVNFFRQVLHPGTAGLGFLQGTVERVEQPLNGLLDGLIRDEVARLDQGGG